MPGVITPRLCIDGRRASDGSGTGVLIQELVDQLVSAQGEQGSCETVEKKRVVLLAHPEQLFSGQWKRFDTGRSNQFSLFSRLWERNFVAQSKIASFHRFLPADALGPHHDCQVLTTVLPARKNNRIRRASLTHSPELLVVPSNADKELLAEHHDPSIIRMIRPSVRRFVHHCQPTPADPKGQLLFLVDPKSQSKFTEAKNIIQSRFADRESVSLSLNEIGILPLDSWVKHLREASLCVYLCESAFDWPILALEAFYFRVPTLFADTHPTLSELLPESTLFLDNFLLENPNRNQLDQDLQSALRALGSRGCFRHFNMASEYGKLYDSLLPFSNASQASSRTQTTH